MQPKTDHTSQVSTIERVFAKSIILNVLRAGESVEASADSTLTFTLMHGDTHIDAQDPRTRTIMEGATRHEAL